MTYLPRKGDKVTIMGIAQHTYTVVGLRDWYDDDPARSEFALIRDDGSEAWDRLENLGLEEG